MSSECDLNLLPKILWKFFQSLFNLFGNHVDKIRVIVKHPQFVEMKTGGLGILQGCRDIFAILPTPRVATETRSHISDGFLNAISLHLNQGIRQIGIPVSITPVNGKIDAVGIEF